MYFIGPAFENTQILPLIMGFTQFYVEKGPAKEVSCLFLYQAASTILKYKDFNHLFILIYLIHIILWTFILSETIETILASVCVN